MRKLPMILFILMIAGCGTAEPNMNSGSLKISKDVKYGEADYQKIIEPSNELGWKLLPVVEPNEEGNRFISSPSLFMALSMVHYGADGVTEDEILNVLEVPGMDAKELNQANASLMNLLASDSEAIQLSIGNSIWLNKSYQFQEDFAKNNEDYFNAKIEEIDVTDNESVDRINGWVEDSTNGKIKEMMEAPLDPKLVTVLLNAIYFKGDWQYPFEEEGTSEQDFHLVDGTLKKMPLMTLYEELSYLETDDFQAVSLPYGEGEMAMKVFLPKEGTSLSDFEKSLTGENWDKWNETSQDMEGTLQLPKFQLEYEVELNDALKGLGMASAFDRFTAEFPQMVKKENEELFISKVKQKTFLDVNEKGTEAAAATSIEIVEESGSSELTFEMIVDRPFFITIEDVETGLILFMGAIKEPMAGK
ncbi:Serpin (serine protease inhibitor) [Planococcus massiliensis]|uniref:Serpin (Serine protease inhibitor) n=1 Tax=Planococcus massiliensis TaxID=1499687 RepID=A0A098EL44_9BACL|nr:serpin family protein [Planococcus massiliensis]CEG21996.1 Serpin (serine protease inhibitor) [Planococcus massiliensis]